MVMMKLVDNMQFIRRQQDGKMIHLRVANLGGLKDAEIERILKTPALIPSERIKETEKNLAEFKKILGKLTPRQRKIAMLRYGFLGKFHKVNEISRKLNTDGRIVDGRIVDKELEVVDQNLDWK